MFTSSTVPWSPLSKKLWWHFSNCAQDFQANGAIYGEGRQSSKTAQQIPREFCDFSKSCLSSCDTSPSLHTSPSILILDFILILILFENEGWQNISKVKWRGESSRLFKRVPPTCLKLFCSKMLLPGFAVLSQAGLTSLQSYLFLFHSVVSSSYMVSLPLIRWWWCLSRNSHACKGCCNQELPACTFPGCPLLRAKTWQCFIFNWWPWFAHLTLNLWASGDSCWLHSPSWGTLWACSDKLFPSLGVGE